ncbi:STAS domain-containing protein [Pontibacter sp. HSC-14F20]|uniref:STAS domain-containing protein n=1 Tax=Pontibacter sp. HSC-14F20 TaxID=2864136 RepID=UPI001C73CD2A|nr:STAS domain-containing protein [Pontibacter sp. HSC-14F20]MBX0332899.1 STAS domain-containing protein [Pontibacter sp. HSC-14F20]
MEITNHTSHQNRHIFFVKGLIKQQAIDQIRQAIAGAPTDNKKELWIDCSHVDRLHLTNSSICSFVSELLKIRKQDVKVVLCDMNATTERMFRLLRLDSLFAKAKSFEEAEQEKSPQIAA